MNSAAIVELDRVDKTFFTRHFFAKDEDTGVRRFYHKKVVHAVDNVSFALGQGEIFGLLGPNGAGKTTIVKMVSGLVRPNGGKVYVDGLHVERKRSKILRRVGVVLEGTRTCIWPLTPLENLSYFGNLKGVRGRVLKTRARELLEFIGLKEKMNVQVRRLSRGQKQKLAICIALIADPPIILLDEPTTGLDVQSARSIKDKVIEMTRTQGKCVLVTTHDMHVAQELCDRIGIIDHGKLVTCRRTDDLLDVFSDQAYEFRLDRLPSRQEIEGLPGVRSVEVSDGEDGPLAVIHLEQAPDARSEALYATVERLRQRGYGLRSINQRKQTLESVFLQLTGPSTKR